MYKPLEKADWEVLSNLAFQIASILIDDMDEGKDEDSELSFEQAALSVKMAEHLEFMEGKYGPHPLILDTKADMTKEVEEKIRLKEKARSLCRLDDYDLRGVICKELAELYFEEKNEIGIAGKLIQEAKINFGKSGNKEELSEANQIEEEIRNAENQSH